MRRPSRCNGTRGPGMLVVTVLITRWGVRAQSLTPSAKSRPGSRSADAEERVEPQHGAPGLQPVQLRGHGVQALDRVDHAHGQVGEDRRHPVAQRALLVGVPDGHGDHAAHGAALDALAARAEQRPQAARRRGEDDVVDRAAVGVLDRLDVSEVGRPIPRPGAGRAVR